MGRVSFAAAVSVLAVAVAQPNTANLTLLTDAAKTQGAVCLDGSPFGLYYLPGAETRKFIIYQQGGGWCNSDYNCWQRSNTSLGSSKFFSSSMNFGSGGYLGNSPSTNPLFYNWTKIYLPYGDGSSQTSDIADPVTVPNAPWPIYYRGHRIFKAVQQWIAQNTPLMQATDVVVTGCSAGGLATYLHADEWKAFLSPSTKLAAMADSGFFLDYNATNNAGYAQMMRWVFNRQNGTGGVPQACLKANPTDPARCIFAEHVSPTLQTPLFALQSQYDSWQIGNILQQPPTNNASINTYGEIVAARVDANLIDVPGSQNAVFLDACYHHCGAWASLYVNGTNQPYAVKKWYESLGSANVQRVWQQDDAYPCTACCNGGGSLAGEDTGVTGCSHNADLLAE